MGSENQENRVRFMAVKHAKHSGVREENAMLLNRLATYKKMK